MPGRWRSAVLATVLFLAFAPPSVPLQAPSSPGALSIRTDTELLGGPILRGGGHITWNVTGIEARSLRQKILWMFDEYSMIPRGFAWAGNRTPADGDGALSRAETRAFTDLVAAEIEGRRQGPQGLPWRYMRIERAELAESSLPVDLSVDGLVGRRANSTDPIEIRFAFEGRTVSETYAFPLASRTLADGLYAMFGIRQAQTLDALPAGVWPLQVMGGWHTVRLPGDGRTAFWAGNTAADADPMNGTYANGARSITMTATNSSLPWVDLRFASRATVSFSYMGRTFDARDTLRLQVAAGPSFATWIDLTDGTGRTVLPNTADYAWRRQVYNVPSTYFGKTVQFRLVFEADVAGNQAPGFLVRDFAIDAPASYSGELLISDVDYLAGALDFQDVSVEPGRLNLIRLPFGEVLIYRANLTAGTPSSDVATYRSFMWYENPQILFAVLFMIIRGILQGQKRAFRVYRSGLPPEYLAAARPSAWLIWLGRGASVGVVLLYLVPTTPGFFGSSVVITGPAFCAAAILILASMLLTTWSWYRHRGHAVTSRPALT